MAPRTTLDAEHLGAYFALMEVSSQLRHAVEQQLREAGDLTYVQFQVLATLSDPPGERRMTDLADRLVLSRSALTYQVAQLERRGLVQRAPSPEDERSTTVRVTDGGRALLDHVLPGHVDVVDDVLLAGLSAEDVRVLATVLGGVRDRLRTGPPRSAGARRRRAEPA